MNTWIEKTGKERLDVINSIGQYNKTKGIINEIVAEFLKKDEDINIDPNHILISVGAQEAFAIIVSTICNRESDVILIEDPSYIGVSSFANIFGYNVKGIEADGEGMNLNALRNTILSFNQAGEKVRACICNS